MRFIQRHFEDDRHALPPLDRKDSNLPAMTKGHFPSRQSKIVVEKSVRSCGLDGIGGRRCGHGVDQQVRPASRRHVEAA
jgi:hypothetical protein